MLQLITNKWVSTISPVQYVQPTNQVTHFSILLRHSTWGSNGFDLLLLSGPRPVSGLSWASFSTYFSRVKASCKQTKGHIDKHTWNATSMIANKYYQREINDPQWLTMTHNRCRWECTMHLPNRKGHWFCRHLNKCKLDSLYRSFIHSFLWCIPRLPLAAL